MFKKTLLNAVVLSTLLSVPSVYAANVPTGVHLAKNQSIVIDNKAEPETLDPQLIEGMPAMHIAVQLFEGLVNLDANGKVTPGVATSWENKGNKEFIFHLRHDAKWSNGKSVTAQDFVYAWRRLVTPKLASPYAYYLQLTGIDNVDAIVNGKKAPDTLGVKAIDRYTLKVTLAKQVPYFVKMMACTAVFPVYPPAVEKWGDQWTQPKHMVSNGAYKLSKWVVNSQIVMTRDPDYWNNSKTVISKVTMLPIADSVAAMNRYFAGEIDISKFPVEQYKHLKKDDPNQLRITGALGSYYYSFNMKKAPFNDIRVRKALSYAIDRNIITKDILAQGQLPAYTLTPASVDGFTPPTPAYATWSQAKRLKVARQLMSEAGYGQQGKHLNVTILYNTNNINKKLALAIGQMWKQLGVNVHLENQEWKSYLQTLQQQKFDVARTDWYGDYNEPSTFLSLLTTNNVQNNPKYANPKYDALINTAMHTASVKKRAEDYRQAELLLAKDMPIAPIYQFVNARLVRPTVGGYPMHNAMDQYYVKNMYMKAK
ncbi:ABC transporter substrate-binding protein [Celerinatantimonas yamalensis]|uniref:ABC transporter substrate-binding protein n=2 Tax=Celerinatantimonas yamalensis TaxID=559956 RepID=A0ABW9G1Z8_9GAMM